MRKLVLCLWLAACGGGSDECDPVANTGCDSGLVCEVSSTGGNPICAKPLLLRGTVFRIDTSAAVAGAKVVALDANGSPASSVATTDANGSYTLAIPAARTDDGAPASANVTLRADAAGYATFPSGIRQALPIDVGTAVAEGDNYVVTSTQTDVGLFALEGGGTAAITGSAEVPESRTGVLVVAASAETAAAAIADVNGAYSIFNLPAGTYTVTAYAQGVSYAPAEVTVAAGQTLSATLSIDDGAATATVSGSMQMVNPEGGEATSVILVVESTFNEALARGETPPGLRAPTPGTAPNVTGNFSIPGVPEGKYVVLAAFENDNLVRDPDTAIGNTQILHIEVRPGIDLAIGSSFKITGALDVVGPGAETPEAVTAAPTLTWGRDSGAAEYEVHVYDAFGIDVWSVQHIPSEGSGDVAIPYQGPLDAGMYYQFKAWSIKTGGTRISTTEDLRGVFFRP